MRPLAAPVSYRCPFSFMLFAISADALIVLCDSNDSGLYPFIPTRSVSFEVASFGAEVVHLRRNTGIYHNPKHQRGIPGNTA
jgi:hypothetical protein